MIRCASTTAPLLTLVLALLAGGLGGCAERAQPIKSVAVHAENFHARKETMADLRAAWRTRQILNDARGRKAEERFLVRLSSAVIRFRDTESYPDICRLWNECLKDHLARFPDSKA